MPMPRGRRGEGDPYYGPPPAHYQQHPVRTKYANEEIDVERYR